MLTIVYKIVRRSTFWTEPPVYFSAFVCPTARLEYTVGQPTWAKFGKLMAFATLEQAQEYLQMNQGLRLEIWRAEASEVCETAKVLPFGRIMWAFDGVSKFRVLWQHPEKALLMFDTQKLPTGTLLVDGLTLICPA
jgi:hypothetical protein